MECNKDEANRAMEIAEKKMQKNDFEGALKIALKARSLHPKLDNISQLLSICDVHCSAQKLMLGSDKNWYGILQVEKFADEIAVKKQYRRLALALHPDKNHFPGAEAAFKMICEAYAVLSDPAKKCSYDSRMRSSLRSFQADPPSSGINKDSELGNPSRVQKNVSSDSGNLNQHQTTKSTPLILKECFWTSCPFCSVKYMYARLFVNKNLRCQSCNKTFVGYEIIAKGIPVGPKPEQSRARHAQSKSGSSQPIEVKSVPKQGNSSRGTRDEKGTSSCSGSGRVVSGSDTVQPVSVVQQESGTETKAGVDVNSGEKNQTDASSLNRRKGGETANANAIKRKSGALKANISRKKLVESSESCEDSSHSSMDDIAMEGNIADSATDIKSDSIPDHFTRRSSRKRKHVSYSESDVQSPTIPLKRTCSTTEKDEKQQKDDVDEDPKHEKPNADCSKQETNGKRPIDSGKQIPENYASMGAETNREKPVDIEGESVIKPPTSEGTETDLFSCPDPEFNDFDMLREESSFGENQFWACYDTFDGMPRYYAKVKKVRTSPFVLSITWLEAVPVHEGYKEWVDEALPVGCGSFRLGNTEKTSARLSFSHQVHCATGKKRGSYIIYPRQGEVWALFKDWDISWSSNPENYKEFKYEIVELLSDYVPAEGFKVAYLEKVGGFLSLFKRATEDVSDSFYICPDEVYKFSHMIPYYKLNGSERKGVPVGSFELDPASLPLALPMQS